MLVGMDETPLAEDTTPYVPGQFTLYLCPHGTASGIVEFHAKQDPTDPLDDVDECPPYGSQVVTIGRGEWEDLGLPAEIQVSVSVRDGGPRVGDGGDYPGWTRRVSGR